MNRSKIEYCDHTLNIITGCRYKCEYCYARQMSRRFSGNVKMNIKQHDKYRMENGVYVLDEPFLDETGQQVLYLFGFQPTLHRYRYGVLDKLKMGQNILVGAMADMFGEWVPDSWIYDVFNICRQHPKNNYLFLTVNPERYMDLDLPEETNMYYGTTITKADDVYRAGFLPEGKKKFICIEPLLEDSGKWIKPALAGKADWIIIGAETWKRKGMVVPEFEWIKSIVLEADTLGIPVFMKDSLVDIVKEKNMRRDIPKDLQVRRKSDKVLKRLMGKCVECRKEFPKNDMVSITARARRGGKTSCVAHMCKSCFVSWCEEHEVSVPDIDGLEKNKIKE